MRSMGRVPSLHGGSWKFDAGAKTHSRLPWACALATTSMSHEAPAHRGRHPMMVERRTYLPASGSWVSRLQDVELAPLRPHGRSTTRHPRGRGREFCASVALELTRVLGIGEAAPDARLPHTTFNVKDTRPSSTRGSGSRGKPVQIQGSLSGAGRPREERKNMFRDGQATLCVDGRA